MWNEREPLDVRDILDWADAHYERTGQYPDVTCGRVVDAPREKWINIDDNLRRGGRGLPRGWSLAQLLDELRGKRNSMDLPRHTLRRVLAWVDAHYVRTGAWPTLESGAIADAPGESWHAVDLALRAGTRGLRGGSSLARLLRKKRGVWRGRRRGVPADGQPDFPAHAFSKRVKKTRYSKRMWRRIERLRAGRNIQRLPPITIDQILKWADEHFIRKGTWPSAHTSGLIEGTRGETWWAVEMALSHGLRGLRGDSSLALVLAEHRGVRTRRALPGLSIEQILAWADAHRGRTKHGKLSIRP